MKDLDNLEDNLQQEARLELGYARTNFVTLIGDVAARYPDILIKEEKKFVENFLRLGHEAANLYVRLALRVGPYFRGDKLSYPEVPDIDRALRELAWEGFVALNDKDKDDELLLDLITVPELKKWLAEKPEIIGRSTVFKRLNRGELNEWVLKRVSGDKRLLKKHLFEDFQFVEPLHLDVIQRFHLFFFGNLFQDMSEFILEDLGVMRFEKIDIPPEARPFQSRKEFEQYHFLTSLSTELFLLHEEYDYSTMWKLLKECFPMKMSNKRHEYKLAGIYAKYGRVFESAGQERKAVTLYELSGRPPARERLARMAFNAGKLRRCLRLCQEIEAAPMDQSEREFLANFYPRLKKKLDLPFEKKKREVHPEWEISVSKKNERIEQLTLEELQKKGWKGFYVENTLWKSLFGLVFWDIIWEPRPGVFFNPFQRGPVDLFSREFREVRKDSCEKRIAECRDPEKLKQRILSTYKEKFKTASVLMSWNRMTCDQIVEVLENFKGEWILQILERMSQNLGKLTSGFPDLFIYHPEKGEVFLLEVKGPGDQLRPNQRAWLSWFASRGIPYQIAKVSFR